MKYYRGTCGDFVVKADNHDEAVKAINRRILAGKVPLLEVGEVDMDPTEAEGYGALEEPEGPWVAVEVYGLLVQDTHIFWTTEEAEEWFKKYTGYDYNEWIQNAREGNEPLDLEYDQCTIFTKGTFIPPLDDSFEKPEGIVILPPFYTKLMRDKWIHGLKTKLGGIKLLVNQKLVSRPGPPGFDTVYATDIAWLVSWKPYEDESEEVIERWKRGLPLDIEPALKAGAIDLRG